ncbi:fungal hydrophobin [Coniophora puteana RWD-64-598 SS2]|uniref:Hydrophobin n=1 Tax=Coniophora puteana (strain RWD-64-598) TaxID=741705 RepID=A0A5M3MJX4_CONPW|nr:fungal hydrophobin [Coniophora puteana RWD-64-598 SS2]EIW79529.1 fungal hydrophobin [Coniophora puteana RWD-64-598 SS2]
MHASAFAALAFAAVVVAGGSGEGQCNTGDQFCCNKVSSSSDESAVKEAALLGAVVKGITGDIGFGCTPVGVLSSGGSQCSSAPVCCTDNTFKGLVNLGCSPINVAL